VKNWSTKYSVVANYNVFISCQQIETFRVKDRGYCSPWMHLLRKGTGAEFTQKMSNKSSERCAFWSNRIPMSNVSEYFLYCILYVLLVTRYEFLRILKILRNAQKLIVTTRKSYDDLHFLRKFTDGCLCAFNSSVSWSLQVNSQYPVKIFSSKVSLLW